MNPAPVPFNVEEMRRKAQEKLRELQTLQDRERQQLGQQTVIGPMMMSTTTQYQVPQTQALKPEIQLETCPIEMKNNPYYDARVKTDHLQRPKPRSSLHFHEKGKFEQDAARLRQEAQLAELLKKIATSTRKAGMDSVTDELQVASYLHDTVPDTEWWDVPLLKDGVTYPGEGDSLTNFVRSDAITHYIQHPVPIAPPNGVGSTPIAPRPIRLTKEESRKLRRQRRMAEEKEKQEKIRMGLIPPPPPKMKLSTLHRMKQTDSMQGPTSIDAEVRRQVAERREKHEHDNEARKLTPDQKREKKRRKLVLREGESPKVAVFRLKELKDRQLRFKIEANAHQWCLSGCALVTGDMALVIVEGSERALKRYKTFMLNRIKWRSKSNKNGNNGEEEDEDEEDDMDDDQSDEDEHKDSQIYVGGGNSHCVLVWEGQVKQAAFQHFRTKDIDNEHQVLDLLSKFGIAHYWKVARDYVIPE